MRRIDPTVSLVVSTYNNPAFLRLSMKSLFAQTVLPFEVLIADDGSTDETYKQIAILRKESPIPLVHVWQPDEGFRAGQIRNVAIAAARSEYIVQIDGDILMEPHFIADHLLHRKTKTLLQGSRVFVTEQKTQALIAQDSARLSFFSRGLQRRENALRSRLISAYLTTRYRNPYPLYYARGCNMSFYKDDFIRVNGYSHDFTGWGHEDSELTLRLLNSGCEKHYIKFHCVAYHLHHKNLSRSMEATNKALMDKQYAQGVTRCEHGIDAFLSSYPDFIRE
ncbi:MAG: glycosyltransferase family 2 protein [Tannerellaceae bacterium]|jgi:glycosyltransferase involved in cell wall biosynthesis|nr:glycosyltransferase family 2 protein [Tannerellaceae bacterium]